MLSNHHALIGGPIPAGAGEPTRRGLSRRWPGAYPRGRGGTEELRITEPETVGLSPRARGNHHPPPARPPGGGPIPAGAGEPK